jgi:hypothetical protein
MSVAAAGAESSESAGTDFYGAKVEVDLADTAIVIAPRHDEMVSSAAMRKGHREDVNVLRGHEAPRRPGAVPVAGLPWYRLLALIPPRR